ncbi:MAG: cupin domain-containing protein [Proteobacteria bacterium]|nr:cupin domain-containing protein [Pseudomonadota bacterium]MBS0574363.1 cupin domain-containing protein [Pseudomonadota bacterium]
MSLVVHDEQPVEDWRPGVRSRMLVAAANGARALCVFEQWIAPGNGAPAHRHEVEEVLTILAGAAEVDLGAERLDLAAGQSLIVPAGVRHGFRNPGPGTLHLMATLAAPVFEARYEGAAAPVRRWQGVG